MPKNSLLPWRTPPPFNWARFPLLLPAIALGLGVGLAHWNGYAWGWQALTLLVILLLIAGPLILQTSVGRNRRKASGYLLLLAVLTLGYWRASDTYQLHWADHFHQRSVENPLYQARILEIRPGENRLRAKVEIESVLNQDSLKATRGRALVYALPDQQANRLKVGDRLLFQGELRALKGPLNPDAFDFQSYWGHQYVYHQAFLQSADDWRLLSRSRSSWTDRAEQLRDSWIDKFRPHLADDELAVAAALVLGKRDLISDDLRSAYADTGAVHVLAVSGLHVGIVAFMLAWLFARLLPSKGPGRWLRLLLNLGGIWGFAMLTGFSPSVQRAALMFSVIIIGQQRQRRPNLFNSLSAAAIFILLIDPQQLFGVGFQLSFSAVAGIGLFQRRINRSLFFPQAGLRSIWSVLSVSLAAQIGTLPLVIYYFQQFPLYFLLSGSIVILTAYGGLVVGLLHGLVAWLLPVAAPVTGWLLGLIVGLQNAVVYFCRQLPGAAQQLFPINWWQLLLLFAFIGGLAIWLQWRRFKVAVALFGIMLALGVFRLSQASHFNQTEGLVVYHQYGHSLLEARAGSAAVSLQSDLTERQLGFLTKGHHQQNRYQIVEQISLPLAVDTTVYQLANHLQLVTPMMKIHDLDWLVLEGGSSATSGRTSSQRQPQAGFTRADPTSARTDLRKYKISTADRVWIRDGARPRQLSDDWMDPSTIFIFDGSNPGYRRREWQEWTAERDLQLHVTSIDGAWRE